MKLANQGNVTSLSRYVTHLCCRLDMDHATRPLYLVQWLSLAVESTSQFCNDEDRI